MNDSIGAAPTLGDIETLARKALAELPSRFRALVEDVILRVDEFPDDDVCNDLGLESPFELMGLYQGVSLDRKSVTDAGAEPDMIFLYRRPLLDHWAETDDTLGHLVRHVLIHEVGHHFGLSDADMTAIEDATSRR